MTEHSRRWTDNPMPPMRRATDGTLEWPEATTPVDKVKLLQAAYSKARIHADMARREADATYRELEIAMLRLVEAATGDHK